jgi:hypothetical protein
MDSRDDMKNPHLTWFSFYWLAWIIMFLVPEMYWLYTNSANTLSAEVWSLEDIDMRQPFDFPMWTATHWSIALVVWLLFLWLCVHFPFGLLR